MAKKTRVDYRPNRPGTGELLRTAEMEAVLAAAAERGKAYAEQISPRDTGRYASSFRVETTRRGGPNSDRAEARIVNTAEHAGAVEYVNSNGRVLGRTAEHIEHTEH